MNKLEKKLPERRSIRLEGYDYSQPGGYFITICTQWHKNLFGKIIDRKMVLNDAGGMIEKWYHKLDDKFPGTKCHEHIVMPNHFHGIIEILDTPVGMAQCGHPRNNNAHNKTDTHMGASLHDIMDWFKTMTTNAYIRGVKNQQWPRFDKRFWQLRYWEHIIRNKNEYSRITQYIIDNPEKWDNDKLNGGNGNNVMEPHTEYGDKQEEWMV